VEVFPIKLDEMPLSKGERANCHGEKVGKRLSAAIYIVKLTSRPDEAEEAQEKEKIEVWGRGELHLIASRRQGNATLELKTAYQLSFR
jgi:hypothetical protein